MLFGPDSSEGRLERLVARCQELFEAGELVAMDELLQRHSDLAAAVRLRVIGEHVVAAASRGVPDRIGPFEVLGVLGEGGMGCVYLAQQTTPLRRLVAVKVIRAGMDSRTVLARFEGERQALAMLDHEHIARVLEAGATEAGQPYFVMEYIRGEPITDYCDRHRLDTRARVGLFVDLCRAVQHAHERGLVHRDLKPANVLVTQRDGSPVVKVIDFGVACATADGVARRAALTEHGQVIGTPHYMAPEQCGSSAGGAADPRSDVFSLGVMLCELLCGALPFDPAAVLPAGCFERQPGRGGDDPAVPSTIVLRGMPEARAAAVASAEALVGELRGDLDWITFKALRANLADRYQSASELAEDLSSYLVGGVVSARSPGLRHRLRCIARRYRSALRAAGVALIAAAAGAGGVIGLRGGSDEVAAKPFVLPMVRLEPSRRVDDELRVTNDGPANVMVQFVDAEGRQLRTVEVPGGQTVTQTIPMTRLTKATPIGGGEARSAATARAAAAAVSTRGRSSQAEPICCMDCLAAGTRVRTEDGGMPIERVTPGMLLPTADGGVVRVLAVHRANCVEMVCLRWRGDDGEGALLATAGHPFLTVSRGWVAAGELRAEDHLQGDDAAVELLALTVVNGATEVWSLELDRPDAVILVGGEGVGVATVGSARTWATSSR